MITSVSNDLVKRLLNLTTKKGRDESGHYIVEGFHLVQEAANANLLVDVFCTPDTEFDFHSIEHVSMEIIQKISDTKTAQPIIGVVKKCVSKKLGHNVVVLDNVQDPGNVGTIIRTAAAFGYDSIVLGTGCADVFSQKVLRASQGAVFNIDVITGEITDILSDFNGEIIATVLDENAVSFDQVNKTKKQAIIFGNEGNGISKGVQKLATKKTYVPISGTESLNVAICAGIVLYKLK